MQKKILKNKPLVEAIFELRWNLVEVAPKFKTDPHYKLLIGSIYDQVKKEFSFHEPLPTSNMPDEIAAYVVQHRFRKERVTGWPLIQIGPGIITFNDTDGYEWTNFQKGINFTVESLLKTYPDKLVVEGLVLRYINTVPFNYKDNIFDFISDRMKVNINLPTTLFAKTGVNKLPVSYDIKFAFSTTKPQGKVSLRFARGKKLNDDALIWETVIKTNGERIPQDKVSILQWIEEAHSLVELWFFTLIEGQLLKEFE